MGAVCQVGLRSKKKGEKKTPQLHRHAAGDTRAICLESFISMSDGHEMDS